MANGNAARLPFPETASFVAVTKADKPAAGLPFDERLGGIAGWVGAILVAITDVSARALQEVQEDGQVTAATKALGGDLVTRLYELQRLSLGKLDFDDLVRREGRLQLRSRHGVDLSEAAVDELTSAILAAVARVTMAVRAELN